MNKVERQLHVTECILRYFVYICALEPFAKPQLSDFFVEIHIKHAYCITNILLVCRNQVIQLYIFVLSGLFILHEVHVHVQVLQLPCNYV